MRIAFLALKGCCDYERIGGAESLIRRLASGLSRAGHNCDYVLYGFDSTDERLVDERIRLRYCTYFEEALSKLTEGYDHVVMIYVSPRHRPSFLKFQRTVQQKKPRFHKLMLGTPRSPMQWLGFLAEGLMLTKGGQVFTISTQTQTILRRLKITSTLLLPAVPESYFVPVEQKRRDSSLVLTYIGRLDREKGLSEVTELFSRLRDFDGIRTQIYGYRWSNDRTTLTMEYHHDCQVSESTIDTSQSIYNPEMEDKIRAILKETDILVLPYHSMNGTIDPPLLLLEGMASGCAILTCPVGNVAGIYGESSFMISGDFVEEAYTLVGKLKNNPELLERERDRERNRTVKLDYSTSAICSRFTNHLQLQGDNG